MILHAALMEGATFVDGRGRSAILRSSFPSLPPPSLLRDILLRSGVLSSALPGAGCIKRGHYGRSPPTPQLDIVIANQYVANDFSQGFVGREDPFWHSPNESFREPEREFYKPMCGTGRRRLIGGSCGAAAWFQKDSRQQALTRSPLPDCC